MRNRADLLTGTAVALGGVALGFGLGAAVHRFIIEPLRVDCSLVGAGGGEVAGVPYLERMRGGAHPDEAVPMVVLFHSLGASPEGHSRMLANIGRARLILPEGAYRASGAGRKWWELGVKAGVNQDPEGARQQWQGAADRAAEFVRQIARCRPTVGDPVLTGSSQGGEMTLLLASEHPRLVQSGVAVSSYLLEPFWNAHGMAPVRMIHGRGDRTVPYAWAKDYAQQMVNQGAPVTWKDYASPGHAVTKEMSNDWIASVRGEVARAAGAVA